MAPEALARRAASIIAAARAMLAEPHNMDKRTAYVKAVFNHDLTADALVTLFDRLRAALVGISAVRPSNWTDDEDAEAVAAWRLVDAALGDSPAPAGEVTSARVAHIAAIGLHAPESLTPEQIRTVCASALTQTPNHTSEQR